MKSDALTSCSHVSWVAYRSAHVVKQSTGMLPLPNSSHLLSRFATSTGALHV